jgi:hypothetical protein
VVDVTRETIDNASTIPLQTLPAHQHLSATRNKKRKLHALEETEGVEDFRRVRILHKRFYYLDHILLHSPLLEPIKPNLKPSPTPPPVLVSFSSSSSSEFGESDIDLARDSAAKRLRKRKKGRKRKHVPSQGDTILISHLDPNRPDIAQQADVVVLNSN